MNITRLKPRHKYMKNPQRRKAATLIRQECANYFDGNCVLLDDGETTPCPQAISNSLICKYFRDAVLPGDKLLYAEVMGSDSVKTCAACGQPFRAVSNRAKYCEKCSKEQKRKQAKARMRKYRGRTA